MNYFNNSHEILKRIIKYLIEGLVVSFAAFLIPRRKIDIEEILVIAITAATTFAILDIWAPTTVSNAARWGAGFGIGTSLGAGGVGPIFPAENFIASVEPTESSSVEPTESLSESPTSENIIYEIPPIFKGKLNDDIECKWEVDPHMIIIDSNGKKNPEGYIGKCQTKKGRDHAVKYYYNNV